MAGSATIKHVAKEAGVSVATVSRVMNKSALVAEGTRQVVLEVAARLGYTPHGAARSLITNRTSTVGVLLPDLYGEFFSEVIRGIDQTARREGYHVIVSSSHSDQQDLESALRSMWGRVDGLILMIPDIRVAGIASQLPDGFPVVLMNCAGDTNGHDAISIANYEGAYSMVQHLIGKGHRRIAIIKGADKNYDANERLRGYRAALRDAALPGEPELEVAGDFSEASGYDAASGLARLDPRPTAIFAFNDAMAVGALSAIRKPGSGCRKTSPLPVSMTSPWLGTSSRRCLRSTWISVRLVPVRPPSCWAPSSIPMGGRIAVRSSPPRWWCGDPADPEVPSFFPRRPTVCGSSCL
jgi:LacI family transcriptional regulator